MKKHVFCCMALALALFTASSVWAQNLGIKGGINLASISESASDDLEDYEDNAIVGIQAGLVAELPISGFFAIQPELLWVQKGGKATYTLLGNELETTVRYNHIQLPVLAKIKATTEGSDFGLFFYGGPFASFSLNGKSTVKTTTALGTVEEEKDIDYSDDDNYERRFDWGATFGLGFNVGALFLDLRYDLGINNLLDDDIPTSGPNGDDPYLRTRGIGLTAGFMFGR